MAEKVYQLRGVGFSSFNDEVVFSEIVWHDRKEAEAMQEEFKQYWMENNRLKDIVIDIIPLELR